MKRNRFQALMLALPVVVLPLQGCIEMAVIGAGAAVASSVDRRTTGAQVDDEGIELRATNRVSERFGDKVHINITSYNRSVLVTGEVPDAQTRAEIEKMHREANIILGSCPAGTPKEHVGIRCGLRDAMTKECATGKGKACDGKSYSVTTYEAAIEGYDRRLAKLGPATAPNGGYAHAAKVLAALPGVTAAAADIEARLVLILPFLTVLIAELGTITFLHLGMGHRAAVVTAADVAEWTALAECAPPARPRRTT